MDRLALLQHVNSQPSLEKTTSLLRTLIPLLLRQEKNSEIRKSIATILERLAAQKDSFDVSLLCAAIVSYARTNKTYVLKLVKQVLSNSPALLKELVSRCVDVLKNVKVFLDDFFPGASEREKTHSYPALGEVALIVKVVVFADSQSASLFGSSEAFVELVADIYRSSGKVDNENIVLLKAKADLLEAMNACLDAAYFNHLPEKVSNAMNIVLTLSEEDRAPSISLSYVPLLGPGGLINDLDYFFNLSEKITKLYEKSSGNEELGILLSTLKSLTEINGFIDSERRSMIQNWLLAIDEEINEGVIVATNSAGMDKGKNKDEYDDVNNKVSFVRDVLPDAPDDLIKTLLKQQRYSGSAEKVIEALLEESDWELLKKQEDMIAAAKEPLDIRRVKIGKMNPTEFLSGNKSSASEMRETIMSLVKKMEEEDLLEEEYKNTWRKSRGQEEVLVEFDEEDDDYQVKLTGVQINESESEEEENLPEKDHENSRHQIRGQRGEDEENNPHHPRIREILEHTYMSNPNLFARDARTRRSDARTKLREATLCTDEVLEGWKIMFERNPRKDKILQDRAFGLSNNNSSNKLLNSSFNSPTSTSRSTVENKSRYTQIPASTSQAPSNKTKTSTNHKPNPRHQHGRGRGNSSRGRRD